MGHPAEKTQTKTLAPLPANRTAQAGHSQNVIPRVLGHKPQPKKISKTSGLLFLLLAVALVGAAFFFDPGQQKSKATHKIEQSKVENLVNKHLIMTNKKIELEQEKLRLEHLSTNPEVGASILPRGRHGALYGVEQNSDRSETNAIRDLERTKEMNLASPDAVIQSEFADRQSQEIQISNYRNEYARQFIANARAAGFAIELDDNFVVKSVKKIKPQEEAIFGRLPSAAQ